jgi:predicted Zn-dependent protease
MRETKKPDHTRLCFHAASTGHAMLMTPPRIALLWALILSATACTVNPVTLEQEFNIVRESREIDIGRTAHPQILKQFGYYYDQNIQNYVDDIGQRLAAVSRRRDLEYTFTVLDTDMVNAFAVPGGYVYVTRGIMAYFNREAELAGVLAHEIGHIVGRDSATMMSQSLLGQFATLAAIAAGAASSSSSGMDAAIATSQLYSSLMLGFSREREYRADEQSVEYMSQLGYDPFQMASFMRTLSYMGQGPTGPQQYLSTHPYIFDRIARIEAKAKADQAMRSTMRQLHNRDTGGEGQTKVRAEQYKSYLEGMAFGPRERLRHIKLYQVQEGDTFADIARKTMGSAVKAQELALLNGMPEGAQLIPGATLKILH